MELNYIYKEDGAPSYIWGPGHLDDFYGCAEGAICDFFVLPTAG